MRTKNTTESEKSCIRESTLERKWQFLQLDLLLKLQFSLQLPSFVWPTYSASTKYFSNQSCHYQCSFKMKPNKQFLITLFNGSHFSLSLHNLTLLEELRILRHIHMQEWAVSVLAKWNLWDLLSPSHQTTAHCVHFHVRTFIWWFQEGSV